MGYLIDTNVISEFIKTKQNQKAVKWFNSIQWYDLHLSVLTIGEIKKGIYKVTDNAKRKKLSIWLDQDLMIWFANRILPVNQQVANKWGTLQAQTNRTLPAIDSLIAATALHFDLILVTRNVNDFNYTGLEVINPF